MTTFLRIAGGLTALISAADCHASNIAFIYGFNNGPEGSLPENLFVDGMGDLYLDTGNGGGQDAGTILRFSPQQNQLTILYVKPNVVGKPGVVTVDPEGNSYGFFGARQVSIFKLTPRGKFTTIQTFDFFPEGLGLRSVKRGHLVGFVNQQTGSDVSGTVFRLSSSGEMTAIYAQQDFLPSSVNEADDGSIIGTDVRGNGSVFKISSGGVFSTTYSFKGYPADGLNPHSVQLDQDGNLTGATIQGGKGSRDFFGNGTAYKVSPSGQEIFDSSFGNANLGRFPYGPFYPIGNGNYIGVTSNGSKGAKYGAIFELSPKGKLSPLYIFSGGADGRYPNPELVPDGHGSFYGTAPYGGAYGKGLIFKFTP